MAGRDGKYKSFGSMYLYSKTTHENFGLGWIRILRPPVTDNSAGADAEIELRGKETWVFGIGSFKFAYMGTHRVLLVNSIFLYYCVVFNYWIFSISVIYLASFHSPDVIFEQLSIIYAIPRYLARSFTVILPYFPTGTMERVDTEGQIATAKVRHQIKSNLRADLPFPWHRLHQTLIYDHPCKPTIVVNRFFKIPIELANLPNFSAKLKKNCGCQMFTHFSTASAPPG